MQSSRYTDAIDPGDAGATAAVDDSEHICGQPDPELEHSWRLLRDAVAGRGEHATMNASTYPESAGAASCSVDTEHSPDEVRGPTPSRKRMPSSRRGRSSDKADNDQRVGVVGRSQVASKKIAPGKDF